MERIKVFMIADNVLKNVEYDTIRMVYNKFASLFSFLPAVATNLSKEPVTKDSEAGGKLGQLDSYEIEGADSKVEILPDLSEFQFVAVQKFEPTHSGFRKAIWKSDAVLSAGEPGNSRLYSGSRCVSASEISLIWRTPWTWTTCARGYGSFSKSREQEVRISDEDDDNAKDESQVKDGDDESFDEGWSEGDKDYEVLDEQRIEDSDDYDDFEEEEVEGKQSIPTKKPEFKQPKPKVVDEGPILNEKITAKTVRLVDDDIKGHKIVSTDEALLLAKKKQMDLVLVDSWGNPPVCKIFNFHREQYRREQVQKERKKKKGVAIKLNEMKELRFNAKTERKDLKMKVDKAKQFLERGYRVKFVANFRGNCEDEQIRREQGKMIDSIFPMMEDIAVIEQGPRVESRLAWVMLRHVKFGKIKKKTPKSAKQIDATVEVDTLKNEDLIHQ